MTLCIRSFRICSIWKSHTPFSELDNSMVREIPIFTFKGNLPLVAANFDPSSNINPKKGETRARERFGYTWGNTWRYSIDVLQNCLVAVTITIWLLTSIIHIWANCSRLTVNQVVTMIPSVECSSDDIFYYLINIMPCHI